jgi:hypothetical protein
VRKGRHWASESRDEGFLGFAATVISLINKNGSVGYAELFNRSATGEQRSYWKDKTTDKIFDQLANSGFPPAMLAVAVCMIGRLNSKARRGAKPVNLMPHEQAFRKLKESGKVTVQNFETALRREKLEVVLRQNRTKKSDRERFMAEAEKSDFKEKWVFDYLRRYKTPADKRAYGQAPITISSKGTPPHQIDFLNGAELTRQMASYWRKHPRFRDCLRFFKPLLVCDIPLTPSDRFFQMPYDYFVNGEIQTLAKVRQLEKANRR